MNVPAIIGSGAMHIGLAAMLLVMSQSSVTVVELFRDCIFPSDIWGCAGIRVHPHDNFDHKPTTIFLHVPVLDDASEILSTPTGKGATR
jgi:hypothetical protein